MEANELMVLYKVNRTVCELLRDRDYIINEANITQTFEEFKEKVKADKEKIDLAEVRQSMMTLSKSKMNPAKQIIVFYYKIDKFSSEEIKKIVFQMVDKQIFNSIIVNNGDLSTNAKSVSILPGTPGMRAGQHYVARILQRIRTHCKYHPSRTSSQAPASN